MLGEDKPQGLGTLAHLGLAVGWRGPSTPWTPLPVALSQTHSHRAPGWETRMAWGGRGTRAAGRRDCSGQLGRLCDMPVPLCPLALSLQLVQDRSRAEEYLSQSLPYLGDAQATLREVAVRFIGEPQPPGSLFWQSPSCPARGLSLPLPPLPTQVGLVAALRSPTPLGYWSSLGSALARGRRACSPGGRAGAVLLGACWGAGGLTTLCA